MFLVRNVTQLFREMALPTALPGCLFHKASPPPPPQHTMLSPGTGTCPFKSLAGTTDQLLSQLALFQPWSIMHSHTWFSDGRDMPECHQFTCEVPSSLRAIELGTDWQRAASQFPRAPLKMTGSCEASSVQRLHHSSVQGNRLQGGREGGMAHITPNSKQG